MKITVIADLQCYNLWHFNASMLQSCKFILKNVFPALTPRLQYELNIDVRRKNVLKLLFKIIIIRSYWSSLSIKNIYIYFLFTILWRSSTCIIRVHKKKSSFLDIKGSRVHPFLCIIWCILGPKIWCPKMASFKAFKCIVKYQNIWEFLWVSKPLRRISYSTFLF